MPFIVTTKSRRRNKRDEKKRKQKWKDGEGESKGQDIYMLATMSSSFMCPRWNTAVHDCWQIMNP